MPAAATRRREAVRESSAPPLRVVAADERRSRKKRKDAAPADYPMQYAECRALGHSWQHRAEEYDEATDGFLPAGAGGYGSHGVVSTCSNCGEYKVRFLTRSGLNVKTKWVRPEGYEVRGADLRPVDWRKSFVIRRFGDD
jgi:hypothetical protein